MNEETSRERQVRVAEAGTKWQLYVQNRLNVKLQGTGIEVIKGGEGEIRKRSSSLHKMLLLPVRASTIEEYVWGDVDLVAVKGNLPIAVISCKVSDHGRFPESFFWGMLYKSLTRIKFVLVTADGGRATKKLVWESELGTPRQPSKGRLLAESYLHGLYVENSRQFCKYIKPGEGTKMGGIVKPLDKLVKDLKRWANEITSVYEDAPTSRLEVLD